jgi:hypothetical protein
VSNVVNLRMVRKQKARAGKEQAAAESRALYGRSKAEKKRDRLEAGKAERFVEAHRRDRSDRGGADSGKP